MVGGHQRLDAVDVLEGPGDYLSDVNVVSLSDKHEIEANVFFNNPSAQGTYVPDLLAPLLLDHGIDPDEAGFTPVDVEGMFAGTEWEPRFFDVEQADVPASIDLGSGGDGPGPVVDIEPAGEKAKAKPSAAEAAKQHRAEMRVDHGDNANTDAETYVNVVCMYREEAEALAEFFGHDKHARFLDGIKVFAKLGLERPKKVSG
jgi:hypothetical protein